MFNRIQIRVALSLRGRGAWLEENSEGRLLVVARREQVMKGVSQMTTQRRHKRNIRAIKEEDRLFVVWNAQHPCGPDNEDLRLSLGEKGKNPVFYCSDGSEISGRVISMADMHWVKGFSQEIPLWGKRPDLEWWKLKISDVMSNLRSMLHVWKLPQDIEMIYCSGPTAKDRWGIFAVGNIAATISNLKEEFYLFASTILPSEKRNFTVFTVFGKYAYSIFLRESEKSMTARGLGSVPDEKLIEVNQWSHLLVWLDFKTWTLSIRNSFNSPGQWRSHKRIESSPNNIGGILGEARNAFVFAMGDEKRGP